MKTLRTTVLLLMLLTPALSARGDGLDNALAMLERLDAVSMEPAWQDTPLAVVVGEIISGSEVPIRVDWEAIRRLGIRPGTPVSLRSRRASALSVLEMLMVALGDDFEKPVFEAFGGQVVITSLDGIAVMRFTEVYEVRDLLSDAELVAELEAQRPPMDEGEPVETPETPIDAEADEPADEPAGNDPAAPSPPADGPMTSRGLLMLILDHVDTEAWIKFGGNRGRITEREGQLVVTVSATTHRRLRNALTLLRRADPPTVTLDAAIVEVPRDVLTQVERRHSRGTPAHARAILVGATTRVLWESQVATRPDSPWSVETEAGSLAIRLEITCAADDRRGLLDVAVDGRIVDDDGRRELSAVISMPRRSGAAVHEFPGAGDNGPRRLLVLIPAD